MVVAGRRVFSRSTGTVLAQLIIFHDWWLKSSNQPSFKPCLSHTCYERRVSRPVCAPRFDPGQLGEGSRHWTGSCLGGQTRPPSLARMVASLVMNAAVGL